MHIPSTEFNTSATPTGEMLAELLRTHRVPPVTFSILDTNLRCLPSTVGTLPCGGMIQGRATVQGRSRLVQVPIQVTRTGKDYLVKGEKELNWGDYGIGDPQHWIARLEPKISLRFEIRLSSRTLSSSG